MVAHTKPVEEVREISAITTASWHQRLCLPRWNSTSHITQGATDMPALVEATGIKESRLITLLTALKSLGLITEHDGRFINSPATARYLTAGAPGDFRDSVRLVNGTFGYESFRH